MKLYLPRTLDPVAGKEADPAIVPTGRERILVVEDHDDVRQAVVDMLGGWGYRVTAVENADAAAAFLNKNADFDLLFTDIVMPGTLPVMEMVSLAQSLQPGIAVLLTSGYARDLIPETGQSRYPMIVKPYGAEALAAKVRSVLSARRLPPQSSATSPEAGATVVTAADLPRRILLVEDEVVLRMSVSDMLVRLGCSVAGVGSAEQALDLLMRDEASTFC